jgi:Cdc6-like AAA superfamily ATPase
MNARLLFNPAQASTDELERTFVARHDLLKQIESDLATDQVRSTPRHWQIVGPRGSGKSHFTELLSRHMRTNHGWRIAKLPEENYRIGTLGELLQQIMLRSEQASPGQIVDNDIDDIKLQERALDRLHTRRQEAGAPLLVIIENLAALFEKQLRSIRDQARLRDILTNNPPFTLVATSTSQSEATTSHSAPLYEFFHNITLYDLSATEITQLIKARADWERNTPLLANFEQVKGRVEAIYHLSGGNPRLALALYRVLQDGVTTELHEQLLSLLDEVTPYYQSRLNDISPQAAKILTEMATSETVLTPAVIARRCRIPTNQATAHIAKLLDERLVIQGGRPDARSRLYELRDRLLRIWIQMRESAGSARKRLRFLAEFFEHWYAGRWDELEAVSKKAMSELWLGLAVGDQRRCVDQLKTLSYLAEIKPGFDDSVVLRTMVSHVSTASRDDVKEHLESMRHTFDCAVDLTEREAAAVLLAECYSALEAEEEGLRYLESVLQEGSHSEAIATRYISALNAARNYAKAWKFGSNWLLKHQDHSAIKGPLAIAAFAVERKDEASMLVDQFLAYNSCEDCRAELFEKLLRVLNKKNFADAEAIQFWNRFLAKDCPVSPTDKQILAAMEVLSGRSTNLKPKTLLVAAEIWKALSGAPKWLLQKGICTLSHSRGHASDALPFILAAAELDEDPLRPFILNHLIHIIPEIREQRTATAQSAQAYSSAMSLIRFRTNPETVSTAFRFVAPMIARHDPDLASTLLDVYREWIAVGFIAEAITPYSEAISVLDAKEPQAILDSLHPETREAVEMLIGPTLDLQPSESEMHK